MNEQHAQHMSSEILDRRLATWYHASRRYNPVFLAVTGFGLIAIFLLGQFGLIGDPSPQLLYVGGITLLFAVIELPLLTLAQQERGRLAVLLGSATAGIFAICLTIFWQGIVPATILIAVGTPLLSLRVGLPRRYILILFLLVIITVVGILYLDAVPPMERIRSNSTSAVASIVFLAAAGLLLVTIASVSQSKRFKSLESLLLTSFVLIVTIPIVMTSVLSAIGAFTNSQAQTFNTLQAVATLKKNQIENLLFDFQNDTRTLLADARFTENVLEVLNDTAIDPRLREDLKQQARLRMMDVLGDEEEAYDEIMVLSPQGEVMISTIPDTEGSRLAEQQFFRQGISDFYAGFVEERLFGSNNLMVATPLAGEAGDNVVGVLALRSNGAAIRKIMETTPGFADAETYLVDQDFRPVTRTSEPAEVVRTHATSDAILLQVEEGKTIYSNYADEQVLGYYEWFPPMQMALLAEVPLSFVVTNSIRALAGTALLALFVIAIAIGAVVVSARAITDPIRTLAQTAARFAAGNLSLRAGVERNDEIGGLANAYNQMAAELQEIISKLEQRVADRTEDLERQTLRLRAAAEIARDATSARDLQALLARAVELIFKRFDFSDTGIFLLDSNKEYAILVASPTQAGQELIRNHYKVQVGDGALVAKVAATGEPRMINRNGDDSAVLDEFPTVQAHARMALPLKVESNIIGVLEVHSSRAYTFNQDDLAIMQVMSDQLAVAIERTRLLQEVERNLRELESAYGQYTRDNWERIVQDSPAGRIGYRFDTIRLERITELPELAGHALTSGTTISTNGSSPAAREGRSVAIPIKLRGQTIGVVSLKLKEDADSSTVSIIESAAERLAGAMESARLYEEARLRADREQLITRVTTAISASTGYQNILQTTIREIGSILGDTEVAIQILDEPGAGRRAAEGEQ